MSSRTARARRRRLAQVRASWVWPFCEHDGHERLVGTAAGLVVGAQENLPPGPQREAFVEGIGLAASQTPPEVLLGVCPWCFCIRPEDEQPHDR